MNSNERPMEIRGWRKPAKLIAIESTWFHEDQAMQTTRRSFCRRQTVRITKKEPELDGTSFLSEQAGVITRREQRLDMLLRGQGS
jgi:hypothetical protein